MDSLSRRTDRSKEIHNKADILCKVKYTNTLPDIPFEPKFIKYAFDNSRFVSYKQTSLEKSHKWDIQSDLDIGVAVDLINRQLYAVGNEPPILHPDDEKLLEDEPANRNNAQRSELNARVVPWLRKTEYIGSSQAAVSKEPPAAVETTAPTVKQRVEETQNFPSREEQISTIENSFAAAQETIEKHYSKPHVHKVAEWYVYPNEKIWAYPCSQVIFDDDPAPASQTFDCVKLMSEALIRAINDQNDEQFMGYFLPDENAALMLEDRPSEVRENETEEYLFRMTREYNWTVKNSSIQEGEENYFFVFEKDEVLYSPLDTRVRLNKRRKKNNKVMTAEMYVQYRPLSEREKRRQDQRLRGLALNPDRFESSEESNEDQKSESADEEDRSADNSPDGF